MPSLPSLTPICDCGSCQREWREGCEAFSDLVCRLAIGLGGVTIALMLMGLAS